MLILPLPARPDWSRPPLVTLGLMLLCLLAFFMQGTDGPRRAEALRYYQERSGLADIEFPAYKADLLRRGKAEEARNQAVARINNGPLATLAMMENDVDFIQRLQANRVITPSHPAYLQWRANRNHYERLRARVVTDRYALDSVDTRVVTLLTHMFLHADIMHLLGNMAFLFVVGYTVEAALGSWGFLALYLLGGLGAAIPDLLLSDKSYRLSIGASGAISAVMAAYVVLFGVRRINFFYWAFFLMGTARWPALVILPFWLLNELAQKYLFNVGSNVNYLAHFAGLSSGALLVGVWRWRRGGRSAETVHRQDAQEAVEAGCRRAERYVVDMQFGPAALAYRKLLQEQPAVDSSVIAEYLRIARLSRQAELIADATRRLLVAAASRQTTIAPEVLADALKGGIPPQMRGFAADRWEVLINRLIFGRQLEVVENLLLSLAPKSGFEESGARLLRRLAEAYSGLDQEERANGLRRLAESLAKRLPKTAPDAG